MKPTVHNGTFAFRQLPLLEIEDCDNGDLHIYDCKCI